MPYNKNKHRKSSRLWLVPIAACALVLLMTAMMRGHNIALLNPKGLIASDQSRLIFLTVAILLAIAIPSVLLLFFTAWKFRESNIRATYAPDNHHGRFFVFTIWLIPGTVMLLLAFILWTATHKLAPQNPIASSSKTLQIQVVALRWKWVFIYPQQNIATVNYVQIPLDRPVEFDLTADEAPMSSFWIPNLGGQLYAMTGMVNKLNLMANTLGAYPGSSPEINGAGFAGMQFTARASTNAEFVSWIQAVKKSQNELNATTYAKLMKPSENNPPAFYASAERGLYDKVLMKYMMPMAQDKNTVEHKNDNLQAMGHMGGDMQMMGHMNMENMNGQ